MNDVELEKRIQEKGLTAPRLTPSLIDSKIKKVDYYVHANVLTICVIELENGYFVTGESACASPENFDESIGRDVSFKNAREKIWALEGYRLKEQLHQK